MLLSLWGMESDFGNAKDKWDVFRSLATLGYVKYRHPYFRNELIVAMGIMQKEQFSRDKMVSSWAGAMGQTQIHAVELCHLRGRFFRRRSSRYLDQRARCTGLDRQLSAEI